MNTGPSFFEIQADDLDRAMHFYRSVFGWKFTRAEGTPTEYWRIETGGSRGGMLKRPAARPPEMSGANAFMCSMETGTALGGFDAVAEKILGLGGRVALPKFLVPGVCWQGYFLDTEGNAFGLFEVVGEGK